MYKLRLAALTFLLIFSRLAISQTIPENDKLVKGVLDNGLTYYIFPNDYPKNEAVFRLFVKAGSVHEEDHQRGLAHFLEHMAFNGTENFPKNDLVHFLETKGARFGADINAHTSFNETVYKLQVSTDDPELIDSTLLILSDWATGKITIDQEDLDDERGVILSEWLARQDGKKEVNDALLEMMLHGSRFAERIVIGDTAVIRHAAPEHLRDFYERWYRPDLMAIAVVGDVDPEEILQMIQEKFSQSRRSESAGSVPAYEITDYKDNQGRIIINESLKNPELIMIQLGEKSDRVRTEEEYIPFLEMNLINRLFRSRLGELSFSNTDYKSGSVGFSDFINTKGMLMTSVQLIPGRVREGVTRFTTHLNQMYQYGFTESEIEKVKKQYLNRLRSRAGEESPENSTTIMNEIYADFYKDYVVTSAAEEYRLAKTYLDHIDSVSIMEIFREKVKTDQTHYLYSSFEAGEIADENDLVHLIDSAMRIEIQPFSLEVNLSKNLLFTTPPKGYLVSREKIDEVEAEELLLSNGVKVVYKPSVSGKNSINISAFKRGGLYSLDSTDYLSGLYTANIVGQSGAGNFDRNELSYYLAGNSASVQLLIDKTRAGMVGRASGDDAETLFEVMHAKWVYPRASRDVFELTKKKAIENYQNQNKTDQNIFYEDLGYLMRGKNYVTEERTDSRIEEELQYKKILPLFLRFFGDATDFTFVIVSDLSLGELTPLIEKYIGSLPVNDTDPADFQFRYHGGEIFTESAELVRKAGDSEKAVVSLIFQKTELPEDYSEHQMKSKIADDVIRIRLLEEIREKMGLIYSVGVSTGTALYPNPLSRSTISYSADPEDVDMIIGRIEEILKDIAADPSSIATDLEKVKTNHKKSFRKRSQNNLYWSSFIRNSLFNKEYNWDFHVGLDERIDDISVEEISLLIENNFNNRNRIKAILLPK